MGILTDIGSGLGDVAHAVVNAPQEIAALPGAIASGAQALGHAAVQTLGKPLPTFVADPTTGQVVQQSGAPTVGHMVGNILTGALGGLAGSRPGQNFGEGLGSGYAASTEIQRQKQEQQFTEQMANLKQANLQKYQNAVAQHWQQQIFLGGQELKAANERMAQAGQKLFDQENEQMDALGAGRLPVITDMGSLAQLKAQRPTLYKEYAEGKIGLVINPFTHTMQPWDLSTVTDREVTTPWTKVLPDGTLGTKQVKTTAKNIPFINAASQKAIYDYNKGLLTKQGLAERKRYDDGRLANAAKRTANAAAHQGTVERLTAAIDQYKQANETYRQAQSEYTKALAGGKAADVPQSITAHLAHAKAARHQAYAAMVQAQGMVGAEHAATQIPNPFGLPASIMAQAANGQLTVGQTISNPQTGKTLRWTGTGFEPYSAQAK